MSDLTTLSPSRMPIAQSVAKEFALGPTEWRVLIDQIFPSAKTPEAVLMALSYCRARKLDIYKRPVHIVPMWSSVKGAMVETVWPGIAEIRTTAARTGEYAGIDAVEWGPDITRHFDGVGKGKNGADISRDVTFPEWGSVVVYRVIAGEPRAFHTKIYWEETYASTGKSDVPNDMWSRRPRGQFDKCLEAAALRKAFPEEVGSMYAAEEMEGKTIEGAIAAATIVPERQIAPPPPDVPVDVVDDLGEPFEVDPNTSLDRQFAETMREDAHP
jgi:phage recombination protein Bet